jgi:hypothetical protein
MRKIIATALLPIAVLLAAAKPVDSVRDFQSEARRSIFRATATATCLTDTASDPANRPANYGRVCSCAPQRYLADHPDGELPAINAGNYRTILAAEIAACGGDASAGGKTAVEGAPPVAEPPVAVPTASDTSAPATTNAKPEGESMFAWLDDLSLPSLGGMPDWGWWALLGMVIVFFFARRVLRGEPRNNLDGPPRSMRTSAPVQPRHPNLPPRG